MVILRPYRAIGDTMQQTLLEVTYGKQYIKELIKQEVREIDLSELIDSLIEFKLEAGRDIMVSAEHIAIELTALTAGFTKPIQEIVNDLHYVIKENSILSKIEAIGLSFELLYHCNKIVYEIKGINIVSYYDLDDITYRAIDNKSFIPPFVEPPIPWTRNDVGGYYSIQEHVVLGPYFNHHSEEQALDVLNILQDIEWKLDKHILQYEEESNKPFENADSEMQFNALKESSKKVYKEYVNKPFWLMWQFDKRGRQYSSGYHINLQASGYKKAIMSFNKKELITGNL